MALSPGDIIDGKYRIVRLLGEGGMGAVFEGENVRIHRKVAIKVLHGGVAENADAVARFEREAQAAGRIGSEHIVEVLDLGNLPGGDRYMVMEFLDGSSLSGRIEKRGRLTPAEVYPIARQMLEGLEAAHGAGIIHRDLKPDNVYLLKSRGGQADFVKLLDFGISKFSALSGDSGFSMTRTGSVMGTPYYMSPEQAKGAKAMDHRADLYAAGVILYECLTGQVPFNADTFNELLFKIVLEEPPPIANLVPDLDPSFRAIVEKAMARDPAHRFQTSAEFRQALDDWASGNPQVLAAVPRAPAPSIVDPSGIAAMPAAHATTSLDKGTPSPWSSSSPDVVGAHAAPVPKKSSAGLVVAALAGVLVLGGGGVFAAKAMKGGDPAPTETAAATPPPTTEAPKTAQPNTEKVEAPKPVETAAPATASVAPEAPTAAKTAIASRTTAPVTGKPGGKPTATTATAKPPETAPPATTSTGRKIREDL